MIPIIIQQREKQLIYFTIIHTLGYYFCIHYWKDDDWLRMLIGDFFSITAPIMAGIVLWKISRKMDKSIKTFWLLISLGCFSYGAAEGIWNYYELFLKVEVPYPGWTDLFYMLQVFFYLLAFLHRIWSKRNGLHLIKFIFDTCIIMTVAISFNWHFIIRDILAQKENDFLYTFVSLSYPVSDLILLLGAISFYMGSRKFFSSKVLYIIFASLVIQVYADTAFLYLTAHSLYMSGGLYDPLWSLGLLLMGIAGIGDLRNQRERESGKGLQDCNSDGESDTFSFRIVLPYVTVILLLVVMITYSKEINSLIVGSVVSILLVIFRQIFTLQENKSLLKKYHVLNEELELKIEERTIEISNKNEQLLSAVQNMKHMAYHDVLSGLPNRRMFLEKLTEAIAEAKKNSLKFAVAFIDLDRFKNINDTLGHDLGDLLLQYVSKQMVQVLGKNATISRQGGDEFTILLNRLADESELIQSLHNIQSILANPIQINGHELHVSMSIGIAFYPKDGQSPEELLKHADMAMYSAKGISGNSFNFYSIGMNETLSRKIMLENGLRKAIDNDEFLLHYQPQVNIETEEIIGMEALIRWNKGGSGLVPPAEFIPLAEETGLIIPIGEWVLYEACKQAKTWHDSGYDELKLSVNLSPLQFLHENLTEMIAGVLKETKLKPYSLEIEITEGVAVYDVGEVISKMKALRELGVQISIDDFGTGYCSLIYLKRFPINTLKIAQPFIQGMTNSKLDHSLVSSIIDMGHSMGLTVIAEGVETTGQLQSLVELGCDEVQGFIYSKPLPPEQFGSILKMERLGQAGAILG